MNNPPINGNPPPPAASSSSAKSAEELRRNTLNMEKMIKKNVLAASRPGGMKRGLAVVEFFKQQKQQQQHNGDDGEPSQAKRSKKDVPPLSSSSASSSSSAAGASSLVGPPATPLIPKATSAAITATVTSPSVSSSSSSTTSALLAAAYRGSPLRSSARASPLRAAAVRASPMRATRASPLRQVFTSPTRRVVASRLPEVTTMGVPPTHTPVLNLDAPDSAATPLKPPTLPSKSPFQSFQSKFGQSRTGGGGVVTTPSPARPSPPPARRAMPLPPQLDSQPTATAAQQQAKSVVDLTEEKAAVVETPARSQQAQRVAATESAAVVLTPPPPKPLARSLFSGVAPSVATKSLCFSTECVASSIDVSPDGECIVVAFTDGSVRLYEMDSTVPSDRHGYLLGHLDEESNQSSAGAHLRVKISSDGRYAFVGCRSGPRVMMSIHLHNYRNGKDTEDDDMDQLQKSFHSNSRLRGFADAAACPTAAQPGVSVTRSYYLLCGLGIGTMHMWQFTESLRHSEQPEWRHLYSIPTNGNTVVIGSFLPQANADSVLQIAAKCEDKHMRVWSLEPTTNDDGETFHTTQGHFDVPSSKDVISFHGSYAYGIAPTGEACRFRIPSESAAAVRTYFDMERLDMGSSSKSRRSNIILESIYASDDGKTVVAVSAEGIFYYTPAAPEDAANGNGLLRIIGRNASLNAQYKSPMKVYKPVKADGTLLDSVMAVITNPQYEEDDEEGYVNVDTTETWAARWMKPSVSQDCWVCGVRNIRHWQSESQPARKPVEKPAALAVATSSASTSRTASQRPSPSVRASSSKAKASASSDSSPGSRTPQSKAKSPAAEVVARPTKLANARAADEGGTQKKSNKSKPAPVKRLDVDGAAVEEKAPDARSQQEQLVQELARYKERYNQIVTEWQRRLKGERQMRRLWKNRETEFEGQLHETFLKLDAAEQEIVRLRDGQKDAEKRFIFEKLKAEQQTSVKVRYEQLCEQMQERMVALEHQQRLMEQTSRALLQEVDRHVQHSKQSVNGLVDRQQNECILCKDRTAVTAIVPCGHLCFCEEDAEIYRRNFHGGDHVTCPICQREMISMLRIY